MHHSTWEADKGQVMIMIGVRVGECFFWYRLTPVVVVVVVVVIVVVVVVVLLE